MIQVGNRYLVRRKQHDGTYSKSSIQEWKSLEIAESAYKFEKVVKESSNSWSLMSDSRESFWILKSDISTLGGLEYQLIEELK